MRVFLRGNDLDKKAIEALVRRPISQLDPHETYSHFGLDCTKLEFETLKKQLSKSIWRGGKVDMEEAKEHFAERLKRERETKVTEISNRKLKKRKVVEVDKPTKATVSVIVKGKKKVLDPTKKKKKRFQDKEDTKSVADLTWSLEERDDSETKRLKALEKRSLELQSQSNVITNALRSQGHVKKHTKFDESEEDDNLKAEVSEFKLFDSSAEEEAQDWQIETKEAFEGEAGKELLNLQRKFKGDERFQLSTDFKSDSESEDGSKTEEFDETKKIPLDEIEKDMAESKAVALNVLGEMFEEKEQTVTEFTKPSRDVVWTEPDYFDPDAPDASLLLPTVEKKKKETLLKPITTVEIAPLPEPVTEKYFEFKDADAFKPGAFSVLSLVGLEPVKEPTPEPTVQGETKDMQAIEAAEMQTTDTTFDLKRLATANYFFFTIGGDRSLINTPLQFERLLPEKDLREKWINEKQTLMEEYKRKHRSAVRNEKRNRMPNRKEK